MSTTGKCIGNSLIHSKKVTCSMIPSSERSKMTRLLQQQKLSNLNVIRNFPLKKVEIFQLMEPLLKPVIDIKLFRLEVLEYQLQLCKGETSSEKDLKFTTGRNELFENNKNSPSGFIFRTSIKGVSGSFISSCFSKSE